jgi:hypothetical protein
MQPQNRPRGRPPIGKGVPVQVRLQPPELSALDAYIGAHPDPKPTRAQAVRWLMVFALAAKPGFCRDTS